MTNISYIYANIVDLVPLDRILDNIDNEQLDPFLHPINVVLSRLDINVDTGDLERESENEKNSTSQNLKFNK